MRRHAAAGGKNALGYSHPADIFRAGFNTAKDHRLAHFGPFFSFMRAEDNLACCSTRRCRQTYREFLRLVFGGFDEDRMEQLIQ